MSAMTPRTTGLAMLATATLLAVSGCSSETPAPGAEGSPSSTGSTSSSGTGDSTGSDPTSTEPTVDPNDGYGLDLPAGVGLTALGSTLQVGDTAKVAWQPEKKKVGVLALTVTRMRRGTIKDFAGFTLDDATKQSTPYYVDAKVKNLGKTDLGGTPVPLYMIDGNDTLVEASSFQSSFKPCAAQPLPRKFKPGRATEVCLVYIAADHGALAGVSFRPVQKYAPIEWHGKVVKPKPAKKGKN